MRSKRKKLGACPAYPDKGRICWYVAGTLCDGKVQGSLAKKKETCISCDFLLKVKREEGEDFILFDLK